MPDPNVRCEIMKRL